MISKKISESMKGSSWIRAMFEEGERLKKQYGDANIFDFTLGNPIAEPPRELKKELIKIITSEEKGMHRYMTNSGYEDVREEIAGFHRERTGLPFTKEHIIMTVGSAGGINVILKSLIDPGDEVIVLNPYFVEFKFYIENHGGVMRLVDTKDDFHLDLKNIKNAINEKTKAIIINSPNNPTGVIYDEEELRGLASVLYESNKKVFLISDEAYRKIIYDGIKFPDMFSIYEDTIAITSHSKDLALPGERIGYIAISPRIEDAQQIIDAAIFSNRILGFINAPAIMQRLVKGFQKNSVDIADYQKKRDAIYDILIQSGYEVVKPLGAFYIFPKSPIEDDIEFIRHLQRYHILAVPGTGFGRKGYFRIAYCVEMGVIERSAPYFREAIKNIGGF
ncbi:MAG TPA: pyridoxal phosphate-dependent aminotransferase [Syntrophorhabdaceae bacterium]|nr:pyridoxal phosphate-dependent aminotransferase [Syntrophorhabdaceae bacterium]HOT42985.1 pyridoxal phosphate-dependent aminotransferase [Syntrophorhabdaceae bacterium]HQE79350.1 pyridoxal phosphate-dependent aminotransferase [Syntrophorhabdaceae bacterium]HQH43003.1 pyridoxal phosphate-dependent aminotransferase [Syntrophorhabdaceae bacterium]HQK45892.1 pyridoxal phosphate-dependent aminotransferase [Syntrophorhabdaceae bacterium]